MDGSWGYSSQAVPFWRRCFGACDGIDVKVTVLSTNGTTMVDNMDARQ